MKLRNLTLLLIGMPLYLQAQFTGIGTAAPAYRLDVMGGSINTDSFYRIKGQMVLSVGGNGNVFAGVNSGLNNTIGSFNTALGMHSLRSNTAGGENSAFGYAALYNNTGAGNTAVGYNSLFFNTGGTFNTGTGRESLYRNVAGQSNTAAGYRSLFNNNSGSWNTAFGVNALAANTGGNFNTTAGFEALTQNTTGGNNTAMGTYSLYVTAASQGNTALGYRAGFGFNNGSNNTFLGTETDADAAGYINSTAIGYRATVTAADQVRIGNAFVQSIGGYQNWSTLSDGRYKMNIKEEVRGLSFIMKLRPVTYQVNYKALLNRLYSSKELTGSWQQAALRNEKNVYTGLIAQEVEIAALQAGYNFSGVDRPQHKGDLYSLRYADLVVPLIKAVQEQQKMIQSLEEQLNKLNAEYIKEQINKEEK